MGPGEAQIAQITWYTWQLLSESFLSLLVLSLNNGNQILKGSLGDCHNHNHDELIKVRI